MAAEKAQCSPVFVPPCMIVCKPSRKIKEEREWTCVIQIQQKLILGSLAATI